jgi:hypothetical protein
MYKTLYSIWSLLVCLVATASLTAQVNHPPSGTINESVTCGTPVDYYDSGGPSLTYSNGESGTVNFCPDTPGETITISFSSVDLETSSSGSGSSAGGCCWDALTVSDANGTLFTGCGEDSGDGGDACGIDGSSNDLDPNASFTSTAPDGCLTVTFNSDTTQREGGWAATVSCDGAPPPPSTSLNHPISGTVNQTVTCGDDLDYYDSGGPNGNYSNNESGTTVFCPDTPGETITIDFSAVAIETSSSVGCWDFLTISDANGTLVSGCGPGAAGFGFDDLNSGDSYSSTAPDGCLTVSFFSDSTGPLSGWAATVSCSATDPCASDVINPTITCPGDLSGNPAVVNVNTCQINLPDYTVFVNASDNCDTELTLTQDPPASTMIPGPQTLTVTVTATDDAGNSADCTYQLPIVDNSACGCGTPQPGDSCDDGNSNTTNDMIQGDCGCAGTPVSAFNPGDIIITEIMNDPADVPDEVGEYFEVYNTTGAPIDLNGWDISDNGIDAHTINASVVVPAGGFAVLGRNSAAGAYGFGGVFYGYDNDILLANGDDEIILTAPDGTEIDRVEYDGGPNFPDPTGASMNLDPDAFDAVSNDNGANWCASTSAIASAPV